MGLALWAPIATAGDDAQSAPTLETGSVKRGDDSTRTRFVIGLEKKVDYTIETLSNPNRLIINLPDVAMQLPGETGGRAVGLVSSFRAGVSKPGSRRVIIEVTEPVIVASQTFEPTLSGQRLAIEIAPVRMPVAKPQRNKAFTPPFALGAADVQPPLPREAERPEVRAARAYKPVIVIDPGHGGHDSGAVKDGTVEKDVVLAFSRMLKKKLEDSGRYRVIMTRDTDEFIELDERRAIGERNKAALFIAVHADYAQSRARGATIFSLRESVANALTGSAKREAQEHALSNKEIDKVKAAGDTADISAVRSILGDLAQREVDTTKERTGLFSRAVIEYMGETTNMREEPDQQAAFRVLKTAQFPSVLIELAYVTNKEDAAQLKSEEWRGKVADSIKTAVDTYFSQQVARLPM